MKKTGRFLGFLGTLIMVAGPVPAIRLEDAPKKTPSQKPATSITFSPSDFKTGGQEARPTEPRENPMAAPPTGHSSGGQNRDQGMESDGGPTRPMPSAGVNLFYRIIQLDEGVMAQAPADRAFRTDPAGNRIAGSCFQRMTRPGAGAFKRYKDRIFVYDDGTVVDSESRLVMRIREGVPTKNITLKELQDVYKTARSESLPWVVIDPDLSANDMLRMDASMLAKEGEVTVPQLYKTPMWRREELLPVPR
jgi:hypothetical protein